jgi:flagellar motor protein MotB
MGPGMDLAMSLAGVLLVVVVIIAAQLWATSKATKTLEGSVTKSADEYIIQNEHLRAQITELTNSANAQTVRTGRLDVQLKESQAGLEAKARELSAAVEALSEESRRLAEARSALKNAQRDVAFARNEIETEKQRNARLTLQLADEARNRQIAERNLKDSLQREVVVTNKLKTLQSPTNDKPPLITISDAAFRTFKEGSAEIQPELQQYLANLTKELYITRSRYGADVVEIAGHTDELRLGPSKRQGCNIDKELLEVLNGRRDIKSLVPCDNVGLGMARAVAVVNELKSLGVEKDFVLLPLSAGPTIDTGDKLASGDQSGISNPARRRIEIRLRRHGE